jgi:hypothetical protein
MDALGIFRSQAYAFADTHHDPLDLLLSCKTASVASPASCCTPANPSVAALRLAFKQTQSHWRVAKHFTTP